MFSSDSFIVFSLKFMSLVHFKFTFVYSIRECSNSFFYMYNNCSVFPVPLIEEAVFSPLSTGLPLFTLTERKASPEPGTPPGRALISHTFSPDSYWLGWKPHIKTHQSFHLSLMKASTETAALHMWFQLMCYPRSLTLAGWAAFLIFTILFCFPLRICLS